MSIGEVEPSTWRGGEMRAPAPASKVTFNRRELDRILSLYGRKVAEGEWRDYAIAFTHNKAVFFIYRRACEYAPYRIEKNPRLARKQGRRRDLSLSTAMTFRMSSLRSTTA